MTHHGCHALKQDLTNQCIWLLDNFLTDAILQKNAENATDRPWK